MPHCKADWITTIPALITNQTLHTLTLWAHFWPLLPNESTLPSVCCCKVRIKTQRQFVSLNPGHNKTLIDKGIDSQTFWSLLNITHNARKVTHYLFYLGYCSESARVEFILHIYIVVCHNESLSGVSLCSLRTSYICVPWLSVYWYIYNNQIIQGCPCLTPFTCIPSK